MCSTGQVKVASSTHTHIAHTYSTCLYRKYTVPYMEWYAYVLCVQCTSVTHSLRDDLLRTDTCTIPVYRCSLHEDKGVLHGYGACS